MKTEKPKKPKEVDVIIKKMGVTYESLAKEDFGNIKLTDILMDRSIYTPDEWREIEKYLPSVIVPSLAGSINNSSASGLGSLTNSLSTMQKRKNLGNNTQENLQLEALHEEKLAKIFEEYEEKEKVEEKVSHDESPIKGENLKKHPFEVFEEEGTRIVDTFKKFDTGSRFVVRKYFENQMNLLSISNFEKGEMTQMTSHISNSSQSVSAICSVDDVVCCGLESGSVLFLKSQEEGTVLKLDHPVETGESPLSCIDMTKDKKYIVGGYQSGYIVFWDTATRKVIKALRGVHSKALVQIKIYIGPPATSNGPCCISSDASGRTSRVRLDDRVFMFFEDFQEIIKEIDGRVHHLALNTHISASGGSYLLLAYASESMVMVVCVEPELKALFQFNRPSIVRERAISHVGWCTGSLPVQNEREAKMDQSFLVVAWGKHIFLLLFDGIKDSIDQAMSKKDLFKVCGTFEHLKASILFLAVIGESRLAILDGDQKISLLYTGNFKPLGKNANSAAPTPVTEESLNEHKLENHEKTSTPDISNRSSRSSSFYSSQTGPNITFSKTFEEPKGPVMSQINAMEGMYLKFHMLLKDPEGHPKPVFTNHVTAMPGGSCIVFCDNTDTVFYTKIYTWHQYVERLIENGEWIKAISVSMDLYKGKSKQFGVLANTKAERKEKVREVIKDLGQKYLDQALNAFRLRTSGFHFSNGSPNQSIDIEISDYESPGINDKTPLQHFDETICQIVIDILVNSRLFDFLFSEIFSMFEQSGLSSVFIKILEPFVLSQKIKRVPDEFLKTFSKHYQSVNRTEVIQALLMSLDPAQHDLFFLLQICLEFKLFTALLYICPRNIDPDFATPFVKLYSEAKVSESQKDFEMMTQQMMRMLWYLNMTIKGEMFPHEPMGEIRHMEALSKLLPNILNPIILSFVIQYETKIVFEVLFQIFDPKLSPLLHEMSLPKMSNHSEIMKIVSDLSMSQAPNIRNYFFLFVCDASNKCNLKADLKVVQETLDFFIDCDLSDQKGPEKEELDSRIDELITFLRQNEDEIKANLKVHEIHAKAFKCPYKEVYAFCLGLGDSMKAAIETLVFAQSDQVRFKIFDWVAYYMETKALSDKLREEILTTLSDLTRELAEIDIDLTQKLIARYFEKSEVKIIKALKKYPQIQFEIMEKKVQFERSQGRKVDDSLSVLYIKLLCKTHPKRVSRELKLSFYPSDACLKQCLKFNLKEAQAYLYEKTGAIIKSLTLYKELFLAKIDASIEKIKNNRSFSKTFFLTNEDSLNSKKKTDETRIRQLFQYSINLCKVHYKYTEETKVLWFYVLDMILQCQHEKIIPISELFDFRSFAKFYNSLVIDLFSEVVKCVELENLIEKLQKSYGEMKLGALKRSILDLLLNYEQERALNMSVQRVIYEESYKIVRGFIQCRLGAISPVKTICYFCQKDVLQLKVFLCFKCCHLLCQNCMEKKFGQVRPICAFCESFETSKSTFLDEKYHFWVEYGAENFFKNSLRNV